MSATQLAAYVVQAELGDCDPKVHTAGYVSELRLVPNQVMYCTNMCIGFVKLKKIKT